MLVSGPEGVRPRRLTTATDGHAPIAAATPSHPARRSSPRGRPRAFDRDRALLDAARLFWRRGYSGTSTRDLTATLGLSTSSLYAAFGSKAELFEEAVRTYAERYREIYQQASEAEDLATVIERILIDSVHEFTLPDDTHPGCLLSSAAMADSTSTLDTSAYFTELQGSNERTSWRVSNVRYGRAS